MTTLMPPISKCGYTKYLKNMRGCIDKLSFVLLKMFHESMDDRETYVITYDQELMKQLIKCQIIKSWCYKAVLNSIMCLVDWYYWCLNILA